MCTLSNSIFILSQTPILLDMFNTSILIEEKPKNLVRMSIFCPGQYTLLIMSVLNPVLLD